MIPKISFVMAGRNDDFGGNFLNRLQLSVNSILLLSKKYNLPAELILVEWNPPQDKPRLKDAITWPKDIHPAIVRIIEVPHKIHTKFKNSERIPFFEFFAKNVGLRRANGEYVLVTNSDIIFSEGIIKYFSENNLSQDVFCRIDRYDIRDAIPMNLSFEEQLKFCENHIAYIQNMHGMIITSKKEWIRLRILDRIRNLTLKKVINKIKRGLGMLIPESNTNINATASQSANRFRGLFIHVGGDFMLMSKKNWEKFKGYPEVGIDRGLDCYMTIMSHIAGLLQVILPYPIYHMEHDRSTQYLRPTIVLENMPAFEKMIETGKPVLTNPDNWGMADMKFEETVINPHT